MLNQLAVGLVYLHQQIVVHVGYVYYTRLRGRRVRLETLAAVVFRVLLTLRQSADQIEIRVSVASVLQGHVAATVSTARVDEHRIGAAISLDRVEVTVTTSHQIEVALLIPETVPEGLLAADFPPERNLQPKAATVLR